MLPEMDREMSATMLLAALAMNPDDLAVGTTGSRQRRIRGPSAVGAQALPETAACAQTCCAPGKAPALFPFFAPEPGWSQGNSGFRVT